MTKFLKEFKEKGTMSFKYFGNEDLATCYESKCVIENSDFYKKFFAECKLEKIETMEDYCRYFLCAKYEQFEEFVSCVRDEFKDIIRDIAEKAQKSIENVKRGEIIKFINDNIEKIFESKLDVWDIEDVTLDFIEKKGKTGIKEETYKWLSEKRAWALLDRFESFGDIFDKYPDIFDNIFGTGHYDEEIIQCRAETVFDIFLEIHRKKESKLKKTVERVIPVLAEDILSLCNSATKGNVWCVESKVKNFVDFLNKIKSPYANQFVKPLKEIEELSDETLNEYGIRAGFKIPIGGIIDSFKKQKEWPEKIIFLTHDPFSKKSMLESRVEYTESQLLNRSSNNLKCGDFYTASYQLIDLRTRETIAKVNILSIIQDKNLYCDLMKMLMRSVESISESFDCDEENLKGDIEILDKLLQISINSLNSDVRTQIASCYGSAMFTCTLIEKIMRIVYLKVVGLKEYVSINKATLGKTLDPNKSDMRDYFGEKHIRHLAYFLVKDNDKCGNRQERIGLDYRNLLAHWEIKPDEVSIDLVALLMWLFIDIVNTIYIKESKNQEQTQ